MSTDAGLTWQLVDAPAGGAQSMDPDVAFGPDGALWLAWRGDDQLLHVARSEDLGATWTGLWTIEVPGVGTTAFEAVALRADGTVGVAFLGTNATGEPWTVYDGARWDLYLGLARPASAPAFATYRVTDTPVQVGPICYVNQECPEGSRNLLEFIDAQFAPDGALFVAYTEGCIDACDAMPAPSATDSHERQVAVAWLKDA